MAVSPPSPYIIGWIYFDGKEDGKQARKFLREKIGTLAGVFDTKKYGVEKQQAKPGILLIAWLCAAEAKMAKDQLQNTLAQAAQTYHGKPIDAEIRDEVWGLTSDAAHAAAPATVPFPNAEPLTQAATNKEIIIPPEDELLV